MSLGQFWSTNEDGYGEIVEIEVCCDDFAAATKDGTDNEGWGRLMRYDEDTRKWSTGDYELPSISFCPWCGKPK